MAGISHGTTDQAALDSSTKTIFMRCMKALNMIVFFWDVPAFVQINTIKVYFQIHLSYF